MKSSVGRAALLMLAVFLLYGPSMHGTFLWDDRAHVPDRPEVYTLSGLRQIWTSPGYVQQYYPLTFTAVWIAHHAWNRKPEGYHLLTLFFHACNAVLVAHILLDLQIPMAWGAAFLFALHPVQVESAAWISELKNTQSAFFALLAFWSYLRFKKGFPIFYVASFLFYVAALFSKTTASMMPPVLIIVLFYRKRWSHTDIVRLVPFIGAGLLLGLSTARWEKTLIGAAGPDWDFSWGEHLLIAGRAWWFYIQKLLWPHPLIFMYPKWLIHSASLTSFLYPASAALLLIGLWKARRAIGNGPITAFLSYSILIWPALGFVSIYPMRFSLAADHFQYAACIPLLALASAGIAQLPRAPAILMLWCIALAGLSAKHIEAFQNSEGLWRETLAKNPGCVMAHLNLAHDLLERGLFAESEVHLQEAMALEPDNYNVELASGQFALNVQHNPSEAARCFEKAALILQQMPRTHASEGNTMLIHYYWGQALSDAKKQDQARIQFAQTLAAMEPLKTQPYFDTTPQVLAAIRDDIQRRLPVVGLSDGLIK